MAYCRFLDSVCLSSYYESGPDTAGAPDADPATPCYGQLPGGLCGRRGPAHPGDVRRGHGDGLRADAVAGGSRLVVRRHSCPSAPRAAGGLRCPGIRRRRAVRGNVGRQRRRECERVGAGSWGGHGADRGRVYGRAGRQLRDLQQPLDGALNRVPLGRLWVRYKPATHHRRQSDRRPRDGVLRPVVRGRGARRLPRERFSTAHVLRPVHRHFRPVPRNVRREDLAPAAYHGIPAPRRRVLSLH
ncbi:MAG: hypothetical protein BJ554DRAFT_7385, partial [Olpidium bornovanus]